MLIMLECLCLASFDMQSHRFVFISSSFFSLIGIQHFPSNARLLHPNTRGQAVASLAHPCNQLLIHRTHTHTRGQGREGRVVAVASLAHAVLCPEGTFLQRLEAGMTKEEGRTPDTHRVIPS